MNKSYKIDKGLADEYQINTGWIFSHIRDHWKEYDRSFLEKDFQDALMIILNSRKIFGTTFSESQIHYFEQISLKYKTDLETAMKPDFFPFPDYYLRYKKSEDDYPSIVSYEISCIIERENPYFDFFFALKIRTINLMKIDDFFRFHLVTSFKRNKKNYFDFLSKMMLKHDKLLIEKYAILIKNYMDKFQIKAQNTDTKQKKTEEIIKANDLKWVGSETEFVQFVYGLHEARYITNAGDTITKIVPQIAEAFNFKLGNNWQSSLSESIHDRNNDYEPKIFTKIADGYNKYRDTQRSKKKKNSPK